MGIVEIIKKLAQKLSNTLHVAFGDKQTSSLTWKERSAAKKHGWGACHALSLVFEGLSLGIFQEFSDLAAACSEAFGLLVLCLFNHRSLNEKIVLAAMAAICHLPSQLLSQNKYQSEDVGEALALSILFLQYSR